MPRLTSTLESCLQKRKSCLTTRRKALNEAPEARNDHVQLYRGARLSRCGNRRAARPRARGDAPQAPAVSGVSAVVISGKLTATRAAAATPSVTAVPQRGRLPRRRGARERCQQIAESRSARRCDGRCDGRTLNAEAEETRVSVCARARRRRAAARARCSETRRASTTHPKTARGPARCEAVGGAPRRSCVGVTTCAGSGSIARNRGGQRERLRCTWERGVLRASSGTAQSSLTRYKSLHGQRTPPRPECELGALENMGDGRFAEMRCLRRRQPTAAPVRSIPSPRASLTATTIASVLR